MNVTGVNSISTRTQTAGSASNVKSLKDDFMKLLVTQLKCQDPMEPMKDKDFFAQLASFTSASELEELNEKVSSLYESIVKAGAPRLVDAVGMIGKRASALVGDKDVLGTVEAVQLKDGRLWVRLAGTDVSLDDVVFVGGEPNGDQDN